MGFCLLHQVCDNKLPEHGDVPEVDKEQTKVARQEEGERENAKVEEGLVVHPGDDGHPDGKGGQVDPCVQLELFWGTIDAGDDVDDPGLVEHGVHLGDEAEHSEPDRLASEQGAGEAEDDEDVVDEQLARLLVPHHVHRLGHMDADGEGHQGLGGGGRCEHQVVPHLRTRVQSCNCPESSDGGGDSCHERVLPLPQPGLWGEDWSRRLGKEDKASKEVEEEADKEPERRGWGEGGLLVKEGGEEELGTLHLEQQEAGGVVLERRAHGVDQEEHVEDGAGRWKLKMFLVGKLEVVWSSQDAAVVLYHCTRRTRYRDGRQNLGNSEPWILLVRKEITLAS